MPLTAMLASMSVLAVVPNLDAEDDDLVLDAPDSALTDEDIDPGAQLLAMLEGTEFAEDAGIEQAVTPMLDGHLPEDDAAAIVDDALDFEPHETEGLADVFGFDMGDDGEDDDAGPKFITRLHDLWRAGLEIWRDTDSIVHLVGLDAPIDPELMRTPDVV